MVAYSPLPSQPDLGTWGKDSCGLLEFWGRLVAFPNCKAQDKGDLCLGYKSCCKRAAQSCLLGSSAEPAVLPGAALPEHKRSSFGAGRSSTTGCRLGKKDCAQLDADLFHILHEITKVNLCKLWQSQQLPATPIDLNMSSQGTSVLQDLLCRSVLPKERLSLDSLIWIMPYLLFRAKNTAQNETNIVSHYI